MILNIYKTNIAFKHAQMKSSGNIAELGDDYYKHDLNKFLRKKSEMGNK